jgi:hypothetical protein
MSARAGVAGAAAVCWRRLRLKPLWLLVIWSAFALPWLQRKQAKPGEFYPFSNFPMYSAFTPRTYYVLVTDLEDEPVPVTLLTGKVLSNVKKVYDSELRKVKQASGGEWRVDAMPLEGRVQAGEKVLRWLMAFAREDQLEKLGGLRLKQVDLTWEEGRVKKTMLEAGEVRL